MAVEQQVGGHEIVASQTGGQQAVGQQPVEHFVPVHVLRRGEIARVAQLIGQREQVHRLEELGFRKGTRVEMLQPGSPCIVRLGDHRICFRDNESLSILVALGELR